MSVSARNKAAKRRGARWESEIRDYLRGKGYDTEPLKLTGERDEGDLVIRHGGRYFVIEAKNEQTIRLSTYLREVAAEVANFVKHRNLKPEVAHPVAFVKQRGKGAGEAYAVMSIDEYLRLIGGDL